VNFRYVAKLLGQLLSGVSLTMLLPLAWSAYRGEWAIVRIFADSILLGIILGAALAFWGRRTKQEFFRREALAVVSLGWILAAAVGALPFFLSHRFPGGYINCYFEAMSGFTTTGATVLSEIESVPEGLLLWRSFTQWLGGVGIVVLFVAVLPALGVEAKHLYRVEIPGVIKDGTRPRIRESASLLWKIYLGFTVLECAFLMLGGMTFFDALNHTFTTLATGGFSTKNAGIAHFNSLAVEGVIVFFMLAVGVNFSLYASAVRGKIRQFWKEPEFRAYLAFLLGAVILLTLSLTAHRYYPSPATSLRHSLFQAVSIMTTTGYYTADFDQWPSFARILLILLMFVGGSAGSTAGSIKVVRIVALAKMAWIELQHFFFPRRVRTAKLGKSVLPEESRHAVFGFFILFVAVFIFGTVFMAGLGLDPITAASSVIATLGNVGPGLGGVGAVQHYGHIPAPGKIFLSFCMVLGRLEIFTVLVLFLPEFWKK